MRIICKKSNLVKGVSIVSKAVPSKTTMPILECILIDATTDVIKLTANDMELGIETTIDGIIDSRGIIALNAKIFSEIVRKLPDNDVVIETESDNQAIITCEKAKFNIAAQSGDDFSYLPAIEREDFITISEFTLKEVVRQTIFSIADNDTNKMMTGELFEIDNDVLRVVSLDGHRISIRKIELKDAYQPRKVIVPGKTLQEISKIIGGEADAEVEISFTKNHIVFEFDRTLVVSRLIEGEYFRIDQMLSSDYETRVHVNKKELLDCIDRATLLIKEGDKKPIIIDIKNESMYKNEELNRKLSEFAYTKITQLAESKSYKYGIGLYKAAPAFTSQIGKIKYMRHYGISIHVAAAMAIGRRAMGFKERPPKALRHLIPQDNKNRHHWSQWRFLAMYLKKQPTYKFYHMIPYDKFECITDMNKYMKEEFCNYQNRAYFLQKIAGIFNQLAHTTPDVITV